MSAFRKLSGVLNRGGVSSRKDSGKQEQPEKLQAQLSNATTPPLKSPSNPKSVLSKKNRSFSFKLSLTNKFGRNASNASQSSSSMERIHDLNEEPQKQSPPPPLPIPEIKECPPSPNTEEKGNSSIEINVQSQVQYKKQRDEKRQEIMSRKFPNGVRPKLAPQQIRIIPIETLDPDASPKNWSIPNEPRFPRNEQVETLMHPPNLPFFSRVKCSCENCKGSTNLKWDLVNGLKCLKTLTSNYAPPLRLTRKIKRKDPMYTSVLHRKFTAASSIKDLFGSKSDTSNGNSTNRAPHSNSTPTSSTQAYDDSTRSSPSTPDKSNNNNSKNTNSNNNKTFLSLTTNAFDAAFIDTTAVSSRANKLKGSADWKAEVVIIINTFQTSRRAFHDSVRASHLLNCKGVEYFAIDINGDVGIDVPDVSLIRRWRHLHWLFRDPMKQHSKKGNDVLVPQILIDGVPIGGSTELQILEEEHDLDYILAQEACPNCLYNRLLSCGQPPKLNSDGTRATLTEEETELAANALDYCFNCGAVFRELVNASIITHAQTDILMQRNLQNASKTSIPGLNRGKSIISTKMPSMLRGETLAITNSLNSGSARIS